MQGSSKRQTRKPELTPVLKELIKISSLPLASVEVDFAVDSTGFSTSQFGRWYDFKYGKESNRRIWLKAHIACGVKTNIVTGVEVTEAASNDTTQFKGLVMGTAENFTLREVSADKAYMSRENFQFVGDMGAMPYIPFRDRAKQNSKGHPFWKKMWHYYNFHREEFLEHYHKRSNVESTMQMIKSKFGTKIRSKEKTAQVNEVLAKVLCHNICVLIHEVKGLELVSNHHL